MIVDTFSPVNLGHPLNQGKVSWWLCGPSAIGGTHFRDLMGNYNATLTGYSSGQGVVSQTRSGNTIALRGSTSAGYANIGTSGISSRLPTTATRFTVGGWVKANTWNSNYSNLIFRGNNAGGQFGVLFEPGGRWLTQTGGFSVQGNVLSTGVWYWVAYSCNGTALTLYQDGIQINTGTGTPDSTVLRWQMGADTQYSRYLDGWYDDLFVYDRPLSASEILSLYTQSRNGHPETLNRLSSRIYIYADQSSAPSADTTISASSALSLGASATVVQGMSLSATSALSLGAASTVTLTSPATTFSASTSISLGASATVTQGSSIAATTALSLGAASTVTLTSPALTIEATSALSLGASAGVTLTSEAISFTASSALSLGAAAQVAIVGPPTTISATSALSLGSAAAVTFATSDTSFAASTSLSLGASATVTTTAATTVSVATSLALGATSTVTLTSAYATLLAAVVGTLRGASGSLGVNGVYDRVPRTVTAPYLNVIEVGNSREYRDTAGGYTDEGQIQVSVYATTKTSARTIGNAIASTLNDAALTFDEGNLIYFRQDSRPAAVEPDHEPGGERLWAEIRTFRYIFSSGL